MKFRREYIVFFFALALITGCGDVDDIKDLPIKNCTDVLPTATIQVSVFDDLGNGIADAAVDFMVGTEPVEIPFIGGQNFDYLGSVGVRPGQYQLRVMAPGYETQTRDIVLFLVRPSDPCSPFNSIIETFNL